VGAVYANTWYQLRQQEQNKNGFYTGKLFPEIFYIFLTSLIRQKGDR